MYLVDTDLISEARKGDKANAGVRAFFHNTVRDNAALFLSVITIGELRQGVEIIRHRGDKPQAERLERWLGRVTMKISHARRDCSRLQSQPLVPRSRSGPSP